MNEITITRREIVGVLENSRSVAEFLAEAKVYTNDRLRGGDLIPGRVVRRDVHLGGINWVRIYSAAP